MAYLDYILVFSNNASEHPKLPKCQFTRKETKYLEFIINEQGVKPDMDKVEGIKAMPAPRTIRQVRGSIGAIVYYRRFIPAFSRIANPAYSIDKKVCPV